MISMQASVPLTHPRADRTPDDDLISERGGALDARRPSATDVTAGMLRSRCEEPIDRCLPQQRLEGRAAPPRDPETGPSPGAASRSEEHTSELQSLMRNSYAVFCLKQQNNN